MMNNMPGIPQMPYNPSNHPGRRHPEYYQLPPQIPPHYSYAYQYQHSPPPQHYAQQWMPQYQYYQPPINPQQQRMYPQQHSPLVVSSQPHQPSPHVPRQTYNPPQPVRTPVIDQSAPPANSQTIISPSTTPTNATISTATPPISASKSTGKTSESLGSRMPFYPPLPWYSIPDSPFPSHIRHRRRRNKPFTSTLELPLRQSNSIAALPTSSEPQPETKQTLNKDEEPPMSGNVVEEPSSTQSSSSPSNLSLSAETTPATATSALPKRGPTKPVVPIIPITPRRPATQMTSPPPKEPETGATQNDKQHLSTENPGDTESKPTDDSQATETVVAPVKVAPKSWAELLRNKSGPSGGAVKSAGLSNESAINGYHSPKTSSLSDMLRAFDVGQETRLSFLEPRGLVNTGNMCYMNSILQILAYCTPFYGFLDQISKRAVHSFKSDTPLIDAMIMFMREFKTIDSATSAEKLKLRLKDAELEQYGEAFIPEHVYEVIKSLPQFSAMRRGHQQDAEEFLGFLLQTLHDECVRAMQIQADAPGAGNGESISIGQKSSDSTSATGDGWLEVGPKQKPSVTRATGVITEDSPITKIFGGQSRSEFRVPGLKNSVTLEKYQPLQLDISDPTVTNIKDALKGFTRPETVHGKFGSPRGEDVPGVKQAFLETVPAVLIIHLKRFQYDNAGGTQKIWKKVGYPLDLEIPKETFAHSKRAQFTPPSGTLPRYHLIGVVYHHGKNASGGHYTVDVRRQEGREWIRLDDTNIRRIRSEDVAAEGGEEDSKVLAAALEHHKRNQSSDANIYNQAGFNEDAQNPVDDEQDGWSRVNGNSHSPTNSQNKKWSGVVNGTATPSTAGKRTPKDQRDSMKDKVAYILFYQQIR